MGVLSNLVIAIAGTFPAEIKNIKKWVEANGGKWSAKVEKRVTHLIASKEAWKKVTTPVMKATELGIHIVSYDWLEDSLQGRRKLAEKKYTWEVIKKEKTRKRQLKKLGERADGKKFVEGCQKIRELTGSGTSVKLPPARKPRKSRGHFFTDKIDTPFISAKDDLMQRRAEREAAEVAEKAAKAVKKSGFPQAPIENEDDVPTPASSATLPTPPSLASLVKPAPEMTAPLAPLRSTANDSISAEPQAKKLSLKDRYHYYLDSTGFEYKITLARMNPALNSITWYQLSILESHITPHTYCTFVQYMPPLGGVPKSTSGTLGVPCTSLRNPLLNFPKHGDGEPKTNQQTPIISNNANATSDQHAGANRLRALITPALSSADKSYKTLICPIDSDFSVAWRAFRHVFRDLTLLSWEERFIEDKAVQKARAKALNIEPYRYAKPLMGMPIGLRVQEAGLYQGNGGLIIRGDAESDYIRNEFNLPGVSEPLGHQGLVGAAIYRDIEAQRKKEEVEHKKRITVKEAKRVKHNKPLFNCATGQPQTDACERFTTGGRGTGYAN